MPYTPAPIPPSRKRPATFEDEYDDFMGWLPPFNDYLEEVRVMAEDAIAAAPGAIAAAQFKGEYAAGITYQVGHSVSYGGDTWFAKTINTGVAPVAGAAWQRIVAIPAPAGNSGKFLSPDAGGVKWAYPDTPGTLAASYDDLTTGGWLLADGASYLQSAYPALFAAIGQPEPFSSNSLKLASPATLPTGQGNAAVFSADGVYMAVGHAVTPFLTIYKRSGDTFTKLANPATLPTGQVNGMAFSADGVYLTLSGSPALSVYKRSGDVFTKLTDPSPQPAGTVQKAPALSADGIYLAAANVVTAPYLTLYKRSGDVFTKLTDPASMPATVGISCALSGDGVYLAVGLNSGNLLLLYKRAGDTFTKLTDPASPSAGTINGMAFSADGIYLALASGSAPYVTVYKRSGDVFTKLAAPATLPTGQGNAAAFSADGNYLAVGHATNPFLTIYRRNGDTFTKLANPATPLPVSTGNGVAFSSSGEHLAIAQTSTPFVEIYRDYSFSKATEFPVPTAVLLLDVCATKSAKTYIKAT